MLPSNYLCSLCRESSGEIALTKAALNSIGIRFPWEAWTTPGMQNASDPSCVLRLTAALVSFETGDVTEISFFHGFQSYKQQNCAVIHTVQWNHGDFYKKQGQMILLFLFILIGIFYLICGEKTVGFNRACDSCIWHTSEQSNCPGTTA